MRSRYSDATHTLIPLRTPIVIMLDVRRNRGKSTDEIANTVCKGRPGDRIIDFIDFICLQIASLSSTSLISDYTFAVVEQAEIFDRNLSRHLRDDI